MLLVRWHPVLSFSRWRIRFSGKRIAGLRSRFLHELPSILNWALTGYLRQRERGYLLQPDSVRDAIEELEALGSPIATFIKEWCRVVSGRHCTVSDIYAAWRVWCDTNGRREPGTAASFGRDLRAAVPGVKAKQFRDGEGGRARCYEGIDLLSISDW